MKSALSLRLVVCCAASVLPVAAQAQMETRESFDLRGPAAPATAGPIASAMTREAIRLAAAGEPTGGEAVQQSGNTAESNWRRVRGLAPGTEIILTIHGSQLGTRFVVLADDSQLTVLNITGQMIPTAARKVLLDLVSRHPAYFAADDKRETFVTENVRVAPDGVFMADRKVADLGQVVEKIARHDVAEIKAAFTPPRRKQLGPWAAIPGALLGGMLGGAVDCLVSGCGPGSPQVPTGAFVGTLVGAVASVVAPRQVAGGFLGVGGGLIAGGLAGAAIEGDCRPDHPCEKGTLIGAPIGAIGGGLLGYRMAGRKTDGVIYRAP
jgi:hypothetical protein